MRLSLALPLGALALTATILTGGCMSPATPGRFPSLLPRPIEGRGDAEPVETPAVAVPDPATDTAVAALRKTLSGTQAQFAAAAATAQRAAQAAKGEAAGGERWIAAQAALAELDALRATTAGTLTQLDDLAIARAAEGKPAYPALDALREEARTESEAQSARITAIQTTLPAA